MMDKKEIISELESEKKVLEERLGHLNMALRAFGTETTATKTISRKRVHITSQMREKYNNEVVAVLEAYGTSTIQELHERGDFEDLSRTSVYRIALQHPQVKREDRGKQIILSLR